MNALRVALAAVLAGLLASPGWTIELGEPAPPLSVGEWVKGDPVVLADGKDKYVYVVEFWATTCPYSRDAVARLTALQKKYEEKGLVLVGLTTEKAADVKAFVAKAGDKLGYRVGLDDQLKTARAYMGAFQIKTIPYAFLIDRSGNLVWHGHPLVGLEKAVEAVLAGRYDLAAARRVEEARGLARQYFQLVSTPGKLEEAGPIGGKVVEQGSSDAWVMNLFAWEIVSRPGLIKRDLELALRAAQAAYDACEGKNAGVVDTYARVLFDLGRWKEAAEFQRRAVELAEGDELQDTLKSHLEMYTLTASREQKAAEALESAPASQATEGETEDASGAEGAGEHEGHDSEGGPEEGEGSDQS